MNLYYGAKPEIEKKNICLFEECYLNLIKGLFVLK